MAFSFGAATSNPATSTAGFSFGSFGAKTTAPSTTFGFGAPAVATTAPSGFGTFTAPNFGTATTSAAAPSTGFSFGSNATGLGGLGAAGGFSFGGFGLNPNPAAVNFNVGCFGTTATTTTTTGTAFNFGNSLTSTGTFGGFGTTTTSAAAPGSTFSFATPGNATGSLFGNTQQNKGFGFSSGLGAGTTAGTSAFGTGLGTTSLGGFGGFGLQPQQQQQPEQDVRAQQQQFVESLLKVLGNNQMLSVNVEGVKSLPDDQTEVTVYVVERSPNGTSKRIPASTLFGYLEQANIKMQLTQLSVIMSVARTELSPAQLKQLLQNAPAGVDPIIWEQAKVDNPDPERLIPVPMVSFKELLRRLQIQEQMTKQHQTRVDIISNDISDLQKDQATTVAKIAQYKRNLMDLSHRVLQVLIKQEIQRKSGYAIQVDEEHLRVQLDTIQSELNAPTQFKGRLNELMSQIRMQNHFGAVRSEERYSVDADLLREIKQHLKQQQDGLSHLISVIKDDLEDIKLIEHGLSDSGHIRGGLLN